MPRTCMCMSWRIRQAALPLNYLPLWLCARGTHVPVGRGEGGGRGSANARQPHLLTSLLFLADSSFPPTLNKCLKHRVRHCLPLTATTRPCTASCQPLAAIPWLAWLLPLAPAIDCHIPEVPFRHPCLECLIPLPCTLLYAALACAHESRLTCSLTIM